MKTKRFATRSIPQSNCGALRRLVRTTGTLVANGACGKLLRHKRKVENIHHSIAVDVGAGIETCLPSLVAKTALYDRKISAINDAVAIDVSKYGNDLNGY